MKTKKIHRVTFSDKSPVAIRFNLPRGWHELTDSELYELLRLSTLSTSADLPALALSALTGFHVVEEINGYVLCRIRMDGELLLTRLLPGVVLSVVEALEWVRDAGKYPARLAKMRGCAALHHTLHGFKFGMWLRLEQAWQGYLTTCDPDALRAVADTLYPGLSRKPRPLGDVEQLNVIHWMTQIKNHFASLFPHFYRPASGSGEITATAMREATDAQIRALTAGNVTVEQMVLDTDVWRALTELDYKCREMEDLKRKQS